MTATSGQSAGLEGRVRRGFLWSLLSNATLRLGTLVTGILLARIMAPEDFGVYAIALTVQTILMTMSELGLAADLVRNGDIDHRGPTIATLGLVASSFLTAVMWVTAVPVATALGSADAAPVLRVMSVTLLLAGIGVVPYARLQRNLMQGRLFAIDVVSFVITTGLTITLALDGWGPMSLAVGRVVAQVVATGMQFVWTSSRPRFGWRPPVATSGLRFGFPLACAGLLAWTLLSLDNIMVGRLSGAETLGLYVIAFNISSWPTTVVGTAVKAVAMPAFAQRAESIGRPDVSALYQATALTWTVAVPIGLALAVLAEPVIEVAYGTRWLAAAVALGGLGMFGALRVVFDLWIAYLTAAGRAATLVWTQVAWIATLAPVMWVAITRRGLGGAGWSHVVVAAVFMLPLYLFALHRVGVPLAGLRRPLGVPLAAALPAGLLGRVAEGFFDAPWAQLIVGGAVVVLVYAACVWPWLRHQPVIAAGAIPFHRAPFRVRTPQGEK